jgi:hypothetical protein
MSVAGERAGVSEDDSPGNWRQYEAVENHEPEEFDPDSLGPDVPEPPDPSENDADPQIQTRFWALVGVFNVAILGLSVGLMFIAFEGNWDLGGKLAGGGAILGAYGLYRYRETKRMIRERKGGESEGGQEYTEAADGGRTAASVTGEDPGAARTASDRSGHAERAGMRTVEDETGDRYLLLKESAETSLVRDPTTGERRHLDNDSVEVVEGESPLVTAAGGVPAELRTLVSAAHDERALGLLLEIDRRGPVGVRALLAYDLCESDLHGLLAEFRAAGLVTERSVDGERGYDTTESAVDALARLRG